MSDAVASPTTPAVRSRWGWGIALLYISFVIFMSILAGIAFLQHVDLVDTDYYARGEQYQSRIDEQKRSRLLAVPPSMHLNNADNSVTLFFPPDIRASASAITLNCYRPSQSQSDFTLPLTPDTAGISIVRDPRLRPGFWRFALSWMMQGKSYRIDDTATVRR